MTPVVNLDIYVDRTIQKAKQYVADNWDTLDEKGGKLAGRDEQETAAIKKFLESDPHPYDADNVRNAVRRILGEAVEHMQPVGVKRNVTYLAGPIGSKHILMDAVNKRTVSTEIDELRELLQTSIISDFAALKKKFADYSGESVESYGKWRGLLAGISYALQSLAEFFQGMLFKKNPAEPDEEPLKPYGKWRGLLSGMDQELARISREHHFHVVVDNTLAPRHPAEREEMFRHLMEDAANNKIRVFAVALTPEEAKAKAREFGISEMEAEKTARDFQSAFRDICQHVPDVTLLDKDLNVIFKQHDSRPQALEESKMALWQKSFSLSPPVGKDDDASMRAMRC
ncbi:MAG: hypothetical protein KGI29_03505 [Pseudomonadota bacterium]|nr:hypothetical protein [Pseudomonadota bacterium]MDE3037225.1 hypothetical protein [Pseudomonadota bacterium]